MDNYFKGCPPMMSDARFLADYRTDTRRNEYIKYKNRIVRDDTYRQFLQNNATKLMDNDWNYNRKNNSCWANECVHKYPTRSNNSWFVKEKQDYDSLAKPNHQMHPCKIYKDYRMTQTRD